MVSPPVYAQSTSDPIPSILWDQVVAIEFAGTEQVYDIEVEGTHNFIGNGIFAHNTAIFPSRPVRSDTRDQRSNRARAEARTGIDLLELPAKEDHLRWGNYVSDQIENQLRSLGFSQEVIELASSSFSHLGVNAYDALVLRAKQEGQNYPGRVSLELSWSPDGTLSLVIDDNGIGMERDALEALMERKISTKELEDIRIFGRAGRASLDMRRDFKKAHVEGMLETGRVEIETVTAAGRAFGKLYDPLLERGSVLDLDKPEIKTEQGTRIQIDFKPSAASRPGLEKTPGEKRIVYESVWPSETTSSEWADYPVPGLPLRKDRVLSVTPVPDWTEFVARVNKLSSEPQGINEFAYGEKTLPLPEKASPTETVGDQARRALQGRSDDVNPPFTLFLIEKTAGTRLLLIDKGISARSEARQARRPGTPPSLRQSFKRRSAARSSGTERLARRPTGARAEVRTAEAHPVIQQMEEKIVARHRERAESLVRFIEDLKEGADPGAPWYRGDFRSLLEEGPKESRTVRPFEIKNVYGIKKMAGDRFQIETSSDHGEDSLTGTHYHFPRYGEASLTRFYSLALSLLADRYRRARDEGLRSRIRDFIREQWNKDETLFEGLRESERELGEVQGELAKEVARMNRPELASRFHLMGEMGFFLWAARGQIPEDRFVTLEVGEIVHSFPLNPYREERYLTIQLAIDFEEAAGPQSEEVEDFLGLTHQYFDLYFKLNYAPHNETPSFEEFQGLSLREKVKLIENIKTVADRVSLLTEDKKKRAEELGRMAERVAGLDRLDQDLAQTRGEYHSRQEALFYEPLPGNFPRPLTVEEAASKPEAERAAYEKTRDHLKRLERDKTREAQIRAGLAQKAEELAGENDKRSRSEALPYSLAPVPAPQIVPEPIRRSVVESSVSLEEPLLLGNEKKSFWRRPWVLAGVVSSILVALVLLMFQLFKTPAAPEKAEKEKQAQKQAIEQKVETEPPIKFEGIPPTKTPIEVKPTDAAQGLTRPSLGPPGYTPFPEEYDPHVKDLPDPGKAQTRFTYKGNPKRHLFQEETHHRDPQTGRWKRVPLARSPFYQMQWQEEGVWETVEVEAEVAHDLDHSSLRLPGPIDSKYYGGSRAPAEGGNAIRHVDIFYTNGRWVGPKGFEPPLPPLDRSEIEHYEKVQEAYGLPPLGSLKGASPEAIKGKLKKVFYQYLSYNSGAEAKAHWNREGKQFPIQHAFPDPRQPIPGCQCDGLSDLLYSLLIAHGRYAEIVGGYADVNRDKKVTDAEAHAWVRMWDPETGTFITLNPVEWVHNTEGWLMDLKQRGEPKEDFEKRKKEESGWENFMDGANEASREIVSRILFGLPSLILSFLALLSAYLFWPVRYYFRVARGIVVSNRGGLLRSDADYANQYVWEASSEFPNREEIFEKYIRLMQEAGYQDTSDKVFPKRQWFATDLHTAIARQARRLIGQRSLNLPSAGHDLPVRLDIEGGFLVINPSTEQVARAVTTGSQRDVTKAFKDFQEMKRKLERPKDTLSYARQVLSARFPLLQSEAFRGAVATVALTVFTVILAIGLTFSRNTFAQMAGLAVNLTAIGVIFYVSFIEGATQKASQANMGLVRKSIRSVMQAVFSLLIWGVIVFVTVLFFAIFGQGTWEVFAPLRDYWQVHELYQQDFLKFIGQSLAVLPYVGFTVILIAVILGVMMTIGNSLIERARLSGFLKELTFAVKSFPPQEAYFLRGKVPAAFKPDREKEEIIAYTDARRHFFQQALPGQETVRTLKFPETRPKYQAKYRSRKILTFKDGDVVRFHIPDAVLEKEIYPQFLDHLSLALGSFKSFWSRDSWEVEFDPEAAHLSESPGYGYIQVNPLIAGPRGMASRDPEIALASRMVFLVQIASHLKWKKSRQNQLSRREFEKNFIAVFDGKQGQKILEGLFSNINPQDHSKVFQSFGLDLKAPDIEQLYRRTLETMDRSGIFQFPLSRKVRFGDVYQLERNLPQPDIRFGELRVTPAQFESHLVSRGYSRARLERDPQLRKLALRSYIQVGDQGMFVPVKIIVTDPDHPDATPEVIENAHIFREVLAEQAQPAAPVARAEARNEASEQELREIAEESLPGGLFGWMGRTRRHLIEEITFSAQQDWGSSHYSSPQEYVQKKASHAVAPNAVSRIATALRTYESLSRDQSQEKGGLNSLSGLGYFLRQFVKYLLLYLITFRGTHMVEPGLYLQSKKEKTQKDYEPSIFLLYQFPNFMPLSLTLFNMAHELAHTRNISAGAEAFAFLRLEDFLKTHPRNLRRENQAAVAFWLLKSLAFSVALFYFLPLYISIPGFILLVLRPSVVFFSESLPDILPTDQDFLERKQKAVERIERMYLYRNFDRADAVLPELGKIDYFRLGEIRESLDTEEAAWKVAALASGFAEAHQLPRQAAYDILRLNLSRALSDQDIKKFQLISGRIRPIRLDEAALIVFAHYRGKSQDLRELRENVYRDLYDRHGNLTVMAFYLEEFAKDPAAGERAEFWNRLRMILQAEDRFVWPHAAIINSWIEELDAAIRVVGNLGTKLDRYTKDNILQGSQTTQHRLTGLAQQAAQIRKQWNQEDRKKLTRIERDLRKVLERVSATAKEFDNRMAEMGLVQLSRSEARSASEEERLKPTQDIGEENVYLTVGLHFDANQADEFFKAVESVLPNSPFQASGEPIELVFHLEHMPKGLIEWGVSNRQSRQMFGISSRDDKSNLRKLYYQARRDTQRDLQKMADQIGRGRMPLDNPQLVSRFLRRVHERIYELQQKGYRISVYHESPSTESWWQADRGYLKINEAVQAFVSGDIPAMLQRGKEYDEMVDRSEWLRDAEDESPANPSEGSKINERIGEKPKAIHFVLRGIKHEIPLNNKLEPPAGRKKRVLRAFSESQDPFLFEPPLSELHRLRREGKLASLGGEAYETRLRVKEVFFVLLDTILTTDGRMRAMTSWPQLKQVTDRLSDQDILRIAQSFEGSSQLSFEERIFEAYYRAKSNFPEVFPPQLATFLEESITRLNGGKTYQPASLQISSARAEVRSAEAYQLLFRGEGIAIELYSGPSLDRSLKGEIKGLLKHSEGYFGEEMLGPWSQRGAYVLLVRLDGDLIGTQAFQRAGAKQIQADGIFVKSSLKRANGQKLGIGRKLRLSLLSYLKEKGIEEAEFVILNYPEAQAFNQWFLKEVGEAAKILPGGNGTTARVLVDLRKYEPSFLREQKFSLVLALNDQHQAFLDLDTFTELSEKINGLLGRWLNVRDQMFSSSKKLVQGLGREHTAENLALLEGMGKFFERALARLDRLKKTEQAFIDSIPAEESKLTLARLNRFKRKHEREFVGPKGDLIEAITARIAESEETIQELTAALKRPARAESRKPSEGLRPRSSPLGEGSPRDRFEASPPRAEVREEKEEGKRQKEKGGEKITERGLEEKESGTPGAALTQNRINRKEDRKKDNQDPKAKQSKRVHSSAPSIFGLHDKSKPSASHKDAKPSHTNQEWTVFENGPNEQPRKNNLSEVGKHSRKAPSPVNTKDTIQSLSPIKQEVKLEDSTIGKESIAPRFKSQEEFAEKSSIKESDFEDAKRFLFTLRRLDSVTEEERPEVERQGLQALRRIVETGEEEFHRFRDKFLSDLETEIARREKALEAVPLEQLVLELMPDFSAQALMDKLGILFDVNPAQAKLQAEQLSEKLLAALGELNTAANQVITRTAEKGMADLMSQDQKAVARVLKQTSESILKIIAEAEKLPNEDETAIEVLLRIDATDPDQYDTFVRQMGLNTVGIVNGRIVVYIDAQNPKHIELRTVAQNRFREVMKELGLSLPIKFESYPNWEVGMANIEIAYRGAIARGYGAVAVTPEMIPKAINQALNDPSRIPNAAFRELMNEIMAALAVKLGRIRDANSTEAQKLREDLNQKLAQYGISIKQGALGNLIVTWSLERLIQQIQSEIQGTQAQRAAA